MKISTISGLGRTIMGLWHIKEADGRPDWVPTPLPHQKPAIYHFLTMKEEDGRVEPWGHQTPAQSFSQHTCQVEGASSAALPAEVLI